MNNASKVSRTTTRTITLEEHFATPAFLKGPGPEPKNGHRQPSSLINCAISVSAGSRIWMQQASMFKSFR